MSSYLLIYGRPGNPFSQPAAFPADVYTQLIRCNGNEFPHGVDKVWSFTDCTSNAIMKDAGIIEAFAFDRHFEQMGFIRKP